MNRKLATSLFALTLVAAAVHAAPAPSPAPKPSPTVEPVAPAAPAAPAMSLPPAGAPAALAGGASPTATPAAPPRPAPAFASARPCGVGISVGDLNAAVHFYQDMFGFKIVKAPVFPATGVGLATLELGDLRLELVALEGAKSRAEAAAGGDPMLGLRGFFKLALSVDDVDKALAELQAKGASVKPKPATDMETGRRYFFIEDPDGNTIQIFGKAAAK
ncbi:MAG: VOC family protein [Acidobacteriota bacterium]